MPRKVIFFPHPPIVFPEVGGKEAQKVGKTYKGMQKIATEIKEINPEIIVAITPHGPIFEDVLTITALETLRGDLAGFGAPEVAVEFPLATKALPGILTACRQSGLPCKSLTAKEYKKFQLDQNLDHGLVVPLAFFYRSGWRGKLLPLNIAFLPYPELYCFGKVLGRAMRNLNTSWVLLASSDLSHRLQKGAPAGYSPQGAVFDNFVRQSILEGDVQRLLQIDPSLVEEAGECGLRLLLIALGVLDGCVFQAKEISYEGPFGVGYWVACLTKGEEDEKFSPVDLAQKSLYHYLTTGEVLSTPQNLANLLRQKAGAFVTLKKQGDLRGCIGTIMGTKDNLAEEIINNAVAAGTQDPRFPPVSLRELKKLEISVDVLAKPEKVATFAELDPREYGVIVSSGERRGLLLPNLDGVDTVEEQIAIAKAKAGIDPGETVILERFKVTRYH